MSVKLISIRGIMSAVLSRPCFRILRTKFPQYLSFIIFIPGYMDETSLFASILWMVYMPSSALSGALARIGVSI